ncbi:CHAD domain-containing protein [Croceicoccus bisphenolivorans]|uniref:CHAD domain-containing protein n=1 Tax=Croceicoccus bisphenolivorans TaxID=1783232 RepID=UPI000834E934|nr:CHAD domain-containing protein [Croceicoccus bisphenolivorans]
MAYRIRRKDKTVERAVRRIAREQLGKALDALDNIDDMPGAIHDVRKRCKKLRGLLRLVRPVFPDFAAEDRVFREVSALLSPHRDAQVALATFDAIVARTNGHLSQDILGGLRDSLAGAVVPLDHADLAEPVEQCRRQLADARQRAKAWKLDDDGWSALGGGVEKVYARAHHAAETVAAEGDEEAYHRLRRQLKYHWYHTRLLEKLDLKQLRKRAKAARKLSELMGHHHDLAILEEKLRASMSKGERKTAEMLLVLCSRDRAMLENRSSELIAQLLKQSPDALVDDWHGKWKQWRH